MHGSSFRYRNHIYYTTEANEVVQLDLSNPSTSALIHNLNMDGLTIEGATQIESSCSQIDIIIAASNHEVRTDTIVPKTIFIHWI